MPRIRVARGFLRRAEEEAAKWYPRETAALIKGAIFLALDDALAYINDLTDDALRIVERTPSSVSFAIDWGRARRGTVIGLWHSHPLDGDMWPGLVAHLEPSRQDLLIAFDIAAKRGTGYAVLSITAVSSPTAKPRFATSFFLADLKRRKVYPLYLHVHGVGVEVE